MLDGLTHTVFGVVNILMRLAPIGAFGAMAFTIGRYGLSSLGPLAKLIVTLWITSALFVLIVLGAVAALAGFSIIKFLKYIREEIVLTLSLSSSDPALPSLMRKLEKLGCSKALVGLVTPTGYIFNPDGSCIYMTLAAVFVAQATNVPLTLGNYITLFAVAVFDAQRRQRRAGRRLHRARRHADGDSVDSRRRYGAHPRPRSLHEHVPRHHQRALQRCGNAGRIALGKRD